MNLGAACAGAAAVLALSAWMLKQAPKATEGTTASALPGWYRKRLAAAGLSEGAQQNWFAALHASAIATGALGGLWITGGGETLSTAMLIVGGLGAYAGWWAPASWLDARGMQRRVELTTDFPIMLDLVELSLQGGLGLHASWMAVCENLSGSSDAMSEEMRRVDLEVAFGATWTQALAAAAERTGVQEFDALGSLLAQTERFGTEVGRAIRVQCDAMRHEEVESIEERAHRASVKVVIPLVGLLLPATILVTFVPLLIIVIGALADVSPD